MVYRAIKFKGQTMNTILIALLFLYGCEIRRNYVIIEIDKQRPVYWRSAVLRIFVGFIFWIASPFMWPAMTWWQWWGMIPMMALSFWFIFDYGLNLARNVKPLYYINPKGSFLDRFQHKHPNSYVWFWWKFILMLWGLIIFHYGLDAIWNGVIE